MFVAKTIFLALSLTVGTKALAADTCGPKFFVNQKNIKVFSELGFSPEVAERFEMYASGRQKQSVLASYSRILKKIPKGSSAQKRQAAIWDNEVGIIPVYRGIDGSTYKASFVITNYSSKYAGEYTNTAISYMLGNDHKFPHRHWLKDFDRDFPHVTKDSPFHGVIVKMQIPLIFTWPTMSEWVFEIKKERVPDDFPFIEKVGTLNLYQFYRDLKRNPKGDIEAQDYLLWMTPEEALAKGYLER